MPLIPSPRIKIISLSSRPTICLAHQSGAKFTRIQSSLSRTRMPRFFGPCQLHARNSSIPVNDSAARSGPLPRDNISLEIFNDLVRMCTCLFMHIYVRERARIQEEPDRPMCPLSLAPKIQISAAVRLSLIRCRACLASPSPWRQSKGRRDFGRFLSPSVFRLECVLSYGLLSGKRCSFFSSFFS